MFIGMLSWKNRRLGSLASEPILQLLFRLRIHDDQTHGRKPRFPTHGIGRLVVTLSTSKLMVHCERRNRSVLRKKFWKYGPADDDVSHDGVLLGEQAASKPAQQGSNPCAVACKFLNDVGKLSCSTNLKFSECAGLHATLRRS